MDNITVKRFFSLLKGISQCADDCDESRQIQIIREAYRNVHAIADSFNDNLKVTLGIQ